MNKLLLVIDMQNDFRDGKLPVKGCDEIVVHKDLCKGLTKEGYTLKALEGDTNGRR